MSLLNTLLTGAGGGGGVSDIVDDTTPQLGGNLDVNGNSIVSVSNGDIAITPNGTGDVVLDGLKWPQADGTADQVLTTNGTAQLAWADQSGGGGATDFKCAASNVWLPSARFHVLSPITADDDTACTIDTGEPFVCQLPIFQSVTVSELGFVALNAIPDAKIRFAIYTDDSGDLGTRLFESGEVDVSTTGFKWVASSTTLAPGAHWLVFSSNTEGDGTQIMASDEMLFGGFYGLSGVVYGAFRMTYAYGELPADLSFVGNGGFSAEADELPIIFMKP